MKKVLRVLMVIILIAAVTGCIVLFLQKEKIISDRNALSQQNSQLQQSIDAIGAFTTCYTVKTKVDPGDEVVMDNIVKLSVPVSNTSENTVTDIDDICGDNIKENDKYYYKVRVEPNTQLTKDLVMQDYIDAPIYERDVILPFKPIGLKVGDYIDIRVTLPGGEELRAIPHKRVYMVLDNVVKLKLSEGELYVYSTLLTDKQYFGTMGLKVSATKYIEPGLVADNVPVPMYPVSNYAATLMNRDSEIKNKTDYINTDLRNYIEQMLLLYADKPAGTIFPGMPTASHETNEAALVNAAQQLYIDTYFGEEGEPADKTTDISGTGGNNNLDGVDQKQTTSDTGTSNVVGDLNKATNKGIDDLNNAATDLNKDIPETTEAITETSGDTTPETKGNVDSQGNRSNVGTQEKTDAKNSGNIFSDADDIN